MTKELHVVALSGGKDSTAMALRLKELHPDRAYTYVCTPTGNELPEMFNHWAMLRQRLGGNFIPIMGGTLEGQIEKQGCLPNFRMRWCTRILKIEPYAAWLMQQSQNYERIVSYVGIRADEEEREGGDYTNVPGIEMVFPMREWGWGINDVMDYLQGQCITIPDRTDCALCFFQQLYEWWILWKDHPDLYQRGVDLEAATNHTFRTDGRDTWPTSLAGLREKFEAGFIPRNKKRQGDLFGTLQCRVCRK